MAQFTDYICDREYSPVFVVDTAVKREQGMKNITMFRNMFNDVTIKKENWRKPQVAKYEPDLSPSLSDLMYDAFMGMTVQEFLLHDDEEELKGNLEDLMNYLLLFVDVLKDFEIETVYDRLNHLYDFLEQEEIYEY